MADDALKVKVQLEADMDKKQVETEAVQVADTAQKTLDKKELKLKIDDNLKDLKKKLAETRVEYEKLLNQPMWWTTDKQLQQMEDHMEDLRNEIKQNEQALKDMWWAGSKLWNVFQWLIWKVTAWGVALKALDFVKKTFTAFQDAQKALVQATGASGEALQWLTKDMLKVQKEVRQWQQEVAEAIWDLNTRLWLSGEKLQDFTTKYLKFASVTGQESKTAIENSVKLFNAWGIDLDHQAQYLDKLTKAGQMTWVSVQNLTSQLQTNASVLQEMWFNLEDSIALLSNFESAWIEASSVLSAMKMWLKNLVDWWADPANALQTIIDKIKNAKTDSEALEIALNTFWSRGGAVMAKAIRDGTFALEDMTEALWNAKGAVEDTYDEMETLWDYISRKWNGIVAEASDVINTAFQQTRKRFHETQKEWLQLIEDLKLLWKTSEWLGEVWDWLSVEWWKLKVTLGEQWQSIKTWRELWNEYQQSVDNAKEAFKAYQQMKLDDKATQSEFYATKRAAEAAAAWMRDARDAFIEYASLTKGDKLQQAMYKSSKKRKALIQDLQVKQFLSWEYSWSNGWVSTNWWIIGEELLWWWGGGWSKSKAEEMLDSFKNDMKDVYSDMDSTLNEHQKNYDNIVKNIEKTEKEYDKLREKATDTWKDAEKAIKKYNEQLEKSHTEWIKSLWERYVDLQEQRRELDNSYLKDRIGDISDSDWKRIRDEWYTYLWYTYDELKKVKEIYDEIKLIEENTTDEQRASKDFTEKTSKAQEILNDMKEKEAELEEKKAIAMEKQAIAQAAMSQENWKQYIKTLEDKGTFYYDTVKKQREQIHDEDNIEYAKQLENQITNLNDQLKQFKDEKDDEVEILTTITARKIELEKAYEKKFNESIENQKSKVEELYQWWERLIAKKNEYYSSSSVSARAYGWDISNAKVSLVWENWPEQIVARTASYIQPRNASNSYSTVNNNNSSNLTINWMSNTYGSIDEMLDDLRWRLTYRD